MTTPIVPMSGSCIACRFWNANGNGPVLWDEKATDPVFDMDGDSVETAHRRCLRVLHGNGARVEGQRMPSEPAIVTDGSGYAASLMTLPGFGCRLWELRDEP